MSLLTLQFGQCGNQIGEALYSTIFEDTKNEILKPYIRNSLKTWFNVKPNKKWEARSIMIDTETKVIHSIKQAPYDFKNIIVGPYGGCANNWAFGYNYPSKKLIGLVLDKVRQEIERTSSSTTFLNILSSAGGTGSGIGSRIIEELRTEYPKKTFVNVVVLPYSKGEIVTQNYNTILSLSKLHVSSDISILFQNDKLHELPNEAYSSINFSDLNKVIAFQLASIFQPLTDVNNALLLRQLTVRPVFKYLNLKSSYSNAEFFKCESSQSWKTVLNILGKQSKFDSQTLKNSSSNLQKKIIANAVISRGKDKPENEDIEFLKCPKNFSNLLSSDDRFLHHHETRSLCGKEKTLTIISNDNSICYSLNSVLEDGWHLFTKKAYLHHYEKYDVGEKDFQESFQIVEDVLAEYKQL